MDFWQGEVLTLSNTFIAIILANYKLISPLQGVNMLDAL